MKRILSLVLALLMLACCAVAFISCGDNGDDTGKLTYTVTVKDQNGDPVKNAQLVFVVRGTDEKALVKTDASGVATYETADATVDVQIMQASGYNFDKTKTYTFTAGQLNITLEKPSEEKETYTVYVKDSEGNAVAGAKVHICKADNEGFCLDPEETDAEGKATFEVAVGSKWKAKFVDGNEYVSFEDGSKEVTLIQE